jgi:hypothetical protein
MKRRPSVFLSAIILIVTLCITTPVSGNSFFSQFKDPKDGALDLSNWLVERKGFLPVPIVVSDPAVGYGAGAALLFFHTSAEDKKNEDNQVEDDMLSLPPSISFAAGAYTENDSWLVGGGHFGSWKNDSIRYTGAAGGASINLKFFGLNDNNDDNSLAFNIDGLFLFQELMFRIRESNFFLGGRYQFLGSDIDFDDFDDANEIKDISDDELNSSTDGGLGLVARHDSRDNMFSPNNGHYGELALTRYDDIFGGDFDYTYLKASSLSWWGVLSNVVLGVRLDGRFTNGDAPFWSVPFIDMRGIPSLRYQGDNVFVTEVEPRWDVTDRWSLVGFIGSGWAEDSISDFDASSAEIAGGVGFRYLAARRMGMRVGMDIARGPEDTVIYLQVGSGW